MPYENVNGKKTWVHDPNVVKTPKKALVERYSLSEVYIRDEKGGLMKANEIRGTRAQQVQLRRETRSKLKLTSDRVLLYVNGTLRKVGIDTGAA